MALSEPAPSGVFSDHARGLKIGLALVVLLGLGARYAWVATHMESGWRWCLEDPAARDGAPLVFPLWTVTAVHDGDSYEISKVVKGVPVEGDTTPLKVGTTVSVVARFDARRTVAVEEIREIHTLRRWKEGLGVLGFVLVAGAAPFFFRWRAGRVEERRWRT